MKLNRVLVATIGACVGFLSISSSADALLASVKTTGMAATGIAYPQDAFAAAFNPAGAVEICDRLDVGFTWGQDKGHTRIRGNLIGQALPEDIINGTFNGFRQSNTYSPDFGINKRLGCDNEWAVGLVIYNRNYSKTSYKHPFVLLGTSKAGLEYINETASAVVAYRINDAHNIGITVNYQGQRIKVDGLENFDNALRSVHPDHVTNKGYNYSSGWGVTLGWQWHVCDGLTFGLTYQPETSMSRLNKYDGFISGRLNVPAIYSGGIAWRYCENATVAFDVQHYAWSQIRAFNNTLLHKNQDGVQVLERLGSKNGPGFGFQDQTFYRFGMDYMIDDCWTIRAGYRYSTCPIRKSQTVVNILTLDVVQHFFTCGASFLVNENNEVSALFAYGFPHKLKGKNSIPVGPPPVGFGGGEADLKAQKLAIGLSWGWYY